MVEAPARVLRAPVARERVRQALSVAAGLDPLTGLPAGAVVADASARAEWADYGATIRERAINLLAGAVVAGDLMAWREMDDGTPQRAMPLWASKTIWEGGPLCDKVYLSESAVMIWIARNDLDGRRAAKPATIAFRNAGDISAAVAAHLAGLGVFPRSLALEASSRSLDRTALNVPPVPEHVTTTLGRPSDTGLPDDHFVEMMRAKILAGETTNPSGAATLLIREGFKLLGTGAENKRIERVRGKYYKKYPKNTG